MTEKPRVGRAPRTDFKSPITLLMEADQRRWLQGQAAKEERSMGAIVADALAAYRKRTERTRKGGKP